MLLFLFVFHDTNTFVSGDVNCYRLARFREPNFAHVVVPNARPVRVFVLLAETIAGFLVAFAHLPKSEPATSSESVVGQSVVVAQIGVNLDLVLAVVVPTSVADEFVKSSRSPVNAESHSDVRGEARGESVVVDGVVHVVHFLISFIFYAPSVSETFPKCNARFNFECCFGRHILSPLSG